MSDIPTKKDQLVRKMLNVQSIAILVILCVVVGTIVTNLNSVIDLWKKIAPEHDSEYAEKIADQYYVLVGTFPDKKAAEVLYNQLVKLSELSFKYEKEDPAGEFRSSSINIGFEQDQVILAPSDTTAQLWIVGLNLEPDQGSTRSTDEELRKIQKRFSNIENEYSSDPKHELPVTASKVKKYIDSASTKFFNAVKYKNIHGKSITKQTEIAPNP
jgi:hypothetical protein